MIAHNAELVVDASIILKWVVKEPDSVWATAVARSASSLVAPELALSECGSALWKIARRSGGSLSPAKTNGLLATILYGVLAKSRLEIVPCDTAVHLLAARLAGELDHPVYDCLYLALAIARDAALATADLRFARVVLRASALPADRLLTPP